MPLPSFGPVNDLRNELPGVSQQRPRTSDDTPRRRLRSPKTLSKSMKLAGGTGDSMAWGLPDLSCIPPPPRSADSSLRPLSSRSRPGMAWGTACARRSCLCDAPPPLFTKQSAAMDVEMSFVCEQLHGDELERSTGSQDSGLAFTRIRSHRSSVSNAVQLPLSVLMDEATAKRESNHIRLDSIKNLCRNKTVKFGNQFKTHPNSSFVDRIGRMDARRRRKAAPEKARRRLQKQKEMKLMRFNALPEKEREEMSQAFEKFDLDNSGELDQEEIVHCLKEFGLSGMTGEEARAIVNICSDATADDQMPVPILFDDSQSPVVQVNLVDLAITVIPCVRRKLQELRNQDLFRHFTLFDYEQNGQISVEDCNQLAKDLGIDTRIFDECFQAEEAEEGSGDEEKIYRPPPTTIEFEPFQRVVNVSREKAMRERRQREREIQEDKDLDEELFQEFREDLIALEELFTRFDGDHSGCLDKEEVTFMLKDFGLLPTDAKERQIVYDIMESCDDDESEEFDFSEFLGLVHEIRKYAMQRDQDDLQFTFDRYDRDGSGELSIAELSGLLCTLGLVPRSRREQEELGHLIHQIDEDGSGLIDFREFQVLCQRIKEKIGRLRYDNEMEEALKMGFLIEEVHDLRFAFDRLDTSLNGFIDKYEAKQCVSQSKISVRREAFDETFNELDHDDSGELDFIEFAELMKMLRDREGIFQKGEGWSDDLPR